MDFQAKTPDMPDDEWESITADTAEDAHDIYREKISNAVKTILVCDCDSGKIESFDSRLVPAKRRKAQTRRHRVRKEITAKLKVVPGADVNQILALVFGVDQLNLFHEMLAVRGEVFTMSREGMLDKDKDGGYRVKKG